MHDSRHSIVNKKLNWIHFVILPIFQDTQHLYEREKVCLGTNKYLEVGEVGPIVNFWTHKKVGKF